ncbi:MAG: hypothetical protein HY289_01540 [Planctomycetes bacterium]|nr:hypothetical protein [Planctomycetota bacterium]
MRKWHWISIVSVVLVGIGGYWCFTWKGPTPIKTGEQVKAPDDQGEWEESDAIEPLKVNAGPGVAPMPGVDDGPPPPVVLEPGMEQPPRPDGDVSRMPYADE